ncbi:kow motif containing [Trichoderma cornu-damae]|uniref:Kow motif containing n=1 Tax=Trichoderma cornu-damae TaxID=654480 RepID=A0A9P8QJ63_9HYPO|nr:kow motif containing [Trichoderma cornu-damae]
MQKLAKRAAQAQRQATRRARLRMEQDNVDGKLRSRLALRSAVQEVRQNLKDARQARREDWELGPLAPKRDLGFNDYGAFKENVRQDWSNYGLHQPNPKVVEQRCAWAGGVKQLNLAPGDRVVIQDGPDKGKIDRIRSVQPQVGTVTLEHRHQDPGSVASRAEHRVCVQAVVQGMFGNPSRPQPMPISIASVRLVHPITNPETGVTRDVVINQLKAVPPNMQSSNMSLDRWQYGKKWDRVVPGLNVVIPWPEVQVPEFETMAADTVRELVEDRSFYYGLLSPPMPEQVVDELRNKFSRFRTRHEAWYVEKKEAEEALKKGRRDAIEAMQTPLEEFHEKQREARAERREPELSEEMLAKIGEFMAKKKSAALENAGVSQVSAAAPVPPQENATTNAPSTTTSPP